jgi:Ni,Fe-hydrogenase III small subunit/formate hydrogenlyase subunit 6/NADH:ubiquinone oxidoreductase subunit I
MLGWIPRGLRKGRITTAYPRRAERPPDGFHGQIRLLHAKPAANKLVDVCPTDAISIDSAGTLSLDRGRCILCGACVRAAPERFAFDAVYETATRTREELIDDHGGRPDVQGAGARQTLGEQARALRRSIHVRHIDTGSDGSEEWEIQALWNPYYDIQRLGFFLTSSPRHADILIVTGGVTEPMRGPLERTWDVMPAPKALIAAGTDACSGGLSAATGLCAGGVDSVLGVDVYVPGSPPAPIALLDGLLQAVGLVREQVGA